MGLRGWDPIGELLDLQERVNRLFEQTLSPERLEAPLLGAPAWVPAADAHENQDAYVIHIELPGVSEDDVEIQVDADQIVVRGERHDVRQERPETFYRMERTHGPFARGFRFGVPVNPEGVRAQFKDGVLRLDVPKLPSGGRRSGSGERGA